MDLEALEAIAAEPGPDFEQGPEVLDPAGGKADQVEALFKPLFAMLCHAVPSLAAYYTTPKVREISELFTALAEQEGWDLDMLQGKWGLRIAFVMVATPPQAVEWVLSRVVGFATGNRQASPPADPQPQAE